MPTLTKEQFEQKYGKQSLLSFTKPEPQDTDPTFLNRLTTSWKERAEEVKKSFQKTAAGKINPLETSIKTVGQVAGGVGDIIGEAISPQIEKLAKTELARPAFEALSKGMEFYNSWKNSSDTNYRIAEVIESVGNIADLAGTVFGAKFATTAGKSVVKTATKGTLEAVEDIVSLTKKRLPEMGEKASQLFASEPVEQVKTILKETPTSKFDEYIGVAKQASTDPRLPSVFEKVGDKLADATKQLKKQASSLGEQKSIIIEKAKVGLDKFTDAPRQAIIKVMKLKDNPLKDEIISKLKSVKNKLDADKAIDDIQSLLYDATGTKLIAEGSQIEKQLRGIIGEMNTKLKNTLPKSYRVLNDKFANRTKIINTLNRALGEVVEGVPVRGASLVKQFFSPAGSKAKELFEFIKNNTGVDLAQEATLAKFAGELFDDPKVRSLLQGIPRSKTGIISKGLEILTEKSGLGKKAFQKVREASIKKAKEFTKP